jgi:hypothetical protein
MVYNEGRMIAYPAHCRNNEPIKHQKLEYCWCHTKGLIIPAINTQIQENHETTQTSFTKASPAADKT